jgi:nucleotide-binding universal stress UspA family protein
MRVLFATDGSRAADRARDLLPRLTWPAGTRFCVVFALQDRFEPFGTPISVTPSAGPASVEDDLRRHADITLDDAERTLEATGHAVERLTVRGRTASAILDEAKSWKADLVVVGNRGHGPIAAMVLGSVSAEIVDHAPCPVLVVRDDTISSVILAEDGSDGAARARQLLATWPIFHGRAVDVVSVAETSIPWTATMAAGFYDEVLAAYTQDVELVRRQARTLAEETATTLTKAGVAATAHPLEGDAAHELVEFARARPRSLTVIGTRGHSGLARLVLGSVARNVLLHTPGSVLVVREPVAAVGSAEGAKEKAGIA